MITESLYDRFLRFAASLPGAELIDDVAMTESQRRSKKADVFFEKRNVIAEVKSLLTDVTPKIDKVLDPVRERPEFPKFFGKWPMNIILEHLSDGAAIHRQLYEVISSGVADLVSDANRQLRVTKDSFALPGAHGILVILNDSVEILDPNTVAHRAVGTLMKRGHGGGARYSNIGAVWVIGETHRLNINAGLQAIPSIMFGHPIAPDDAAINFLERIQPSWADFMNVPLIHLEQGSFAEMKLIPANDNDDQTTKKTISNLWSGAYDAAPYLRDLSDAELFAYGSRLTLELAALQQHPMATKNTNLRSTRRWSDLNSELNHRHLDVRLVRQLADREGMCFRDSPEFLERTKLLAEACDIVID
jgi:hypothetical protein